MGGQGKLEVEYSGWASPNELMPEANFVESMGVRQVDWEDCKRHSRCWDNLKAKGKHCKLTIQYKTQCGYSPRLHGYGLEEIR